MLKKAFLTLKEHSLALLLILIGGATWSLTMVKSGLVYDYGMGFWGPNGHDGIWHIALIKSLAKGSWQIPTFAGEALQNYHVGYDLLLAWISRITSINPTTLYFQILPPILAVLIGALTYKFVLNWKASKTQALWATFFVYFGGSFGWMVSLLRGQGFAGESMFWAQQGISTLINPPFAFSLVIMLCGLSLLIRKRKTSKDYILAALLFGIVIQIKAYAGVLALGGLMVAGIYGFIKGRKQILFVFLGSLAVALFVFLPLNKDASGLLVFKPFWFLENMMGFSDRLGWPRYYSAMTTYRYGNILHKGIPAYLVAFAIFWFGNLGTRVIKEILVIRWLKNIKRLEWLEVFIASVIIAGAAIPMIFLQEGTPWNTIQFIYYSLFFSGILAGVVLGELTQKTNITLARSQAVGVILLTIPTTLGTLGHYLPSRPPAMISKQELEALKFLEIQPEGVVLTYPFDMVKANEAEKSPPRPLYLYESTAYVSAMTGKDVFLEDEVNLNITGYDLKGRRRALEEFVQSTDPDFLRNFTRNNNISYIYRLKDQGPKPEIAAVGMEKIFENNLVEVFKVK
jgi:hypothetical protein